MTGDYENRLRNLAEGGQPWDVPARTELVKHLDQLLTVLNAVASEPGLTGESGTAASKTFELAAGEITKQVVYLQHDLELGLKNANDQRGDARSRLDSLGSGRLSPGQEAAVRGAVMGTTLVLGPFSFVAGEGAVQAFNNYLAGQREEEAKAHYEAVSQQMKGVQIEQPPQLKLEKVFDEDDPLPPEGPSTPTGGSGPRTGLPTGGGGGGGGGSSVPTGIGTPVPEGPGLLPPPTDEVRPPNPGPGEIIDIGEVPDDWTPTPDGPTGGIGTLPAPGQLPGGGLPGGGAGLPGGGAGGVGSGLGVGLAAGAGGAAALSRLGGGGLGAARAGGGLGGAAGTGGLLGRGGAGGAVGGAGGLGVRGGGAMGGGAMGGGAAGAGAGGRGAGAGAGAGGRAAGGGAGAGARGGVGGGGMGGGAGARGDRKNGQGRGLGGPIAERLEDDEEFGPRSENAGAGERE